MSAVRLNGIEIAPTEWYRQSRGPIQKLRGDIDYGTSESKNPNCNKCVKVLVFKCEIGGQEVDSTVIAEPENKVIKSGAKNSTSRYNKIPQVT